MTNRSLNASSAITRQTSLRSLIGLNAANFFQAEMAGVIVPFLGNFLRNHHWGYDQIGIPIALGGLGVFLMQTPAGVLVDRIPHRREIFAVASLLLGLCYGILPLIPAHWYFIDPLLFLSGVIQAFYAPLLGALALGLVGTRHLNKTIGINQSWNHAGNIVAALIAMALVGWFSLSAIFVAAALVSLAAAAAALLIRKEELDEREASGGVDNFPQAPERIPIRTLLRDRPILTLLSATALFHFANAPVMPMVALYIKQLGGSDVQVAWVVLIAQIVMIPMALLTGILCESWGRKPIFALAFIALPVRIFLYSLTKDPRMLIALQALDGVGAGIYGVAVIAMCSDLSHERGCFNTLIGLMATALGLGGVVGPIMAGFLQEHLGFELAFYVFASVAALAAAIFLIGMPGTNTVRS